MSTRKLEDLTGPEISILSTAYYILDKSLHAHVVKAKILKKVRDVSPKLKKKAFKSLVSGGFLRKWPTGGSITYGLNSKGKKAIEKYLRANINNP